MKILQVCAYAAPYEGNFIKSLLSLDASLKKSGFETIYAFSDDAKDIEWCKRLASKSKVYFLPSIKARFRISTYATIRCIFKENKDIVIAHSHFELYDIPLSITAPAGVKVFWHLHDAIGMNKSFKGKVIHRIQYGCLHKNAILLSVSKKHMQYAISKGFPQRNARYVPNGLDIERIELNSFNENKEYDFGILGWDYYRKGVDLCIKACEEYCQDKSVQIVTIKDKIESIRNNCNSSLKISIVEAYDDINELFDQIKCFLHISRGEGLSYALLEAIYAGLPVICSDIPENQFASEFPTVTMVESENIYSIAMAMSTVKIPSVLDIDVARSKIEEQYSVSSWVERMRIEYFG